MCPWGSFYVARVGGSFLASAAFVVPLFLRFSLVGGWVHSMAYFRDSNGGWGGVAVGWPILFCILLKFFYFPPYFLINLVGVRIGELPYGE